MIAQYVLNFFQVTILAYALIVMGSYLISAIVSGKVVLRYKKMRDETDYRKVLNSPYAPNISIIAPAYNEEVTIVDNIRSLLSMHYSKLTVIIVNDGSKDGTLQTAIDAYGLYKIEYEYVQQVATKDVRGVYKSSNPAFSKLIVVDKHNGGKADAINVGINVCKSELFACIDVDCIIEPDAFLKMAKPFMEATDKPVVAAGGIVWLTNDAIIKNGQLIELVAPKTFIARMQVVEYIRAFLVGRTAWASINGLMLISGAFGLFNKEVALQVGGYNHATVGEDMDLVMRMHQYLLLHKQPYKVVYIPEPLCWTEAPDNFNILSRQRTRWTRGTIECMFYHKKLFFNPRYKIIGLLSYPYWFIAEWLAPIIEAAGIVFLLVMAMLGFVNWLWALSLMMFVYVFAVFISTYSLYIQELAYSKYTKKRDVLMLFSNILLEPFLYHPRVVWWALKGNYQYFSKTNIGWGDMTRQGFKKK